MQDTIEKYLTGQLAEPERAAMEKNIVENPALREEVELQRLLLDEFADPRRLELLEMMADISNNFEMKNAAAKPAQLPENVQPAPLRVSYRRRFLLLAAACFVGLSAAVWLFFGQNQPETNVLAGIGERKQITLPDGSTATLNAGSALRFSPKNWAGRREVFLDGEAFFVVKPGSIFKVNVPDGSVEVLGTEFDVFSRNEQFRVACFTGKVQVKSVQNQSTAILEANQKAVLTAENVLAVLPNDSEKPGWMNGVSNFAAIPVAEVLAEMERQFGISVQFSGENRPFSGSFVHDNLDDALRMVCAPMGLEWKIEGKTVQVFLKK